MLKVLRSNQPIAILLILLPIPVVVLLRWLLPADQEVASVLLYSPVLAIFPPLSHIVWHYTFIVLTGVMLNRLLNAHELTRQPEVLAGFLTVVLAAALPVIQPLSPVLAATPLYLAGIHETLKVYRQPVVIHHYFNAGFIFGTAALLAPSFVTAIFALLASVFYTRTAQWRELMLPLLGFVLPPLFYLVLVWLFGVKTPDDMIYATARLTGNSNALVTWFLYGVVSGLTLLGITRMIGSFPSSSNKSKNSKALLLLFLLAQFTGMFLWVSDSVTLQAQWLLPAAVPLMSYVFFERAGRWQQIVFYLLLVLTALNVAGVPG